MRSGEYQSSWIILHGEQLDVRWELIALHKFDLVVGEVESLKGLQGADSFHHSDLVGIECEILQAHEGLQAFNLPNVVLRQPNLTLFRKRTITFENTSRFSMTAALAHVLPMFIN